MKSCYIDVEHRAIADLCNYYGKGMILTRINVPRAHRGRGIARKLMAEILADADRTRTKLYLEISPSDGLNFDELEAWYTRCGFRDIGGVYRRLPLRDN